MILMKNDCSNISGDAFKTCCIKYYCCKFDYRYSSKLEPDPSLLSSIILCICAAVLWQQSGPKPNL